MIWPLVISVVLRGFAVAGWAEPGPGQPALLTLATFTVAGLLVLAAVRIRPSRRGDRAVLSRVRTALRDRRLCTAFLPQRDPDAAGRPRPRAPGAEIAAA